MHDLEAVSETFGILYENAGQIFTIIMNAIVADVGQ